MTGDPELVRRVAALLSSSGAPHAVVRHAPVRTSEEAAAVRGTSLEDGAKALVCRADGRLVLIVLPANRRLDTRTFKATYGVKDLAMASPAEIEGLGAVIGGVPPFGSLMGLQTYADEELTRRTTLSFNIGSRTVSATLGAADFVRLERPIVGSFSV